MTSHKRVEKTLYKTGFSYCIIMGKFLDSADLQSEIVGLRTIRHFELWGEDVPRDILRYFDIYCLISRGHNIVLNILEFKYLGVFCYLFLMLYIYSSMLIKDTIPAL